MKQKKNHPDRVVKTSSIIPRIVNALDVLYEEKKAYRQYHRDDLMALFLRNFLKDGIQSFMYTEVERNFIVVRKIYRIIEKK